MGNLSSHPLHRIAPDQANRAAMRYAFDLSASLIGCSDYYAMTHQLLDIIQSFPGVLDVSSYEVFTNSAKNTSAVSHNSDLLFRRFPLSLDDVSDDRNIDLLKELLEQSDGPISQAQRNRRTYTLLDVSEEVYPRRAIMVEGELDDCFTDLLEGLYAVYAQQTALLDKKERDALTHLFNRHSLDHIFHQIVDYYHNHHSNPNKSSWIAIIDADHFKKVNDSYGHLYGDEVLIHLANLMKKTFRYTDFIFRFGGEEFIIILNQTSAEGAANTLNRFREQVAKHTFPSGRETVSVGYTHLNINSSLSELLEQADRAVYLAKEKGRNCVEGFLEAREQIGHKPNDDIELF